MAKKKRGKVATWVGMASQYKEYRYGTPRNVGLPGVKSVRPAVRGQRRKEVVSDIIDLLRGWHYSPFEYEGAARAGLRSGLVLAGSRWPVADFEAEQIVAEGLAVLGAKRPSWEEGQPRSLDRGDVCVHCGKPMPEDQVSSGRNVRFCSPECARAAIEARNTDELMKSQNFKQAAEHVIRREKLKSKPCKYCGTMFRAFNTKGHEKQEFCSRKCAITSRNPLPDVACRACGTVFHPYNKRSVFCSRACSDTYDRGYRYTVVCSSCGEMFAAKSATAQFCSTACSGAASNWRTGKMPPKVNRRLFDLVWTAPIAIERHEAQQEQQGAGDVVTLSFSQSPSRAEHEPSTAMFLTTGLFDQMMAA